MQTKDVYNRNSSAIYIFCLLRSVDIVDGIGCKRGSIVITSRNGERSVLTWDVFCYGRYDYEGRVQE